MRDQALRWFLGKLAKPLSFTTTASAGSGRLARGLRVQFPMDPDRVYAFDFLVSPNLNGRGYGLIALRCHPEF